ncbi:MAG TPA: alanine dehydrogenase [Cryomorphaceae bacterium]|nr:alanine dehydrogenase [Owenweeksia sp.]MBG00068.1 alanine dehydrogenase [Owenweeksia sp.]HAD97760.1 alanine dehydrogenase [Cryomorphaceae bacterium]|tara:strand:+ start:4435 stop:5643 length:1209 start_codon:yes stop_codon:yes gene_type:complete
MSSSSGFLSFSKSELLPQEEVLEVKTPKSELQIGIPKEIFMQEKRVGLTPDAVHVLVSNGHQVVIETGAGEGANYSDQDFSEAGARIVYSPKDVYECNIILKIEPPSLEEIDMMKSKQTLISALQLKTQKKAYFRKLMDKKITALSFENIEDEDGIVPVVRSMSEIAGNTSVLVAAEYLSNANDGKGFMLGGVSGVPPTEVVIIGAGTVGVFAARTALGLGANVKVFDKSLSRLRRLQNMINNMPIYTCVMQPKILEKSLMRCDVAIGAVRADIGPTPCVVTDDMVSKMKPGSVIVDVSIDQGGCFETSELTNHDKPTFKKYDVIHYCVPNIASRVSRTASFSLSNIMAPIILSIGDQGGVEEILAKNKAVRKGLYVCKGTLVNSAIGDWFDLPYTEAHLLF